MIIDSHCHLDLLEKQGFNIDEIVVNATANNVKILQTICTRISKIEEILQYVTKYDNVYASIGNHPCNVDEEPAISAQGIIEICAKNKKIIGIGETGLDYFHKDSTIQNQKKSFLEHIKASQILQMPLIIHSRDCDKNMIEILKSEQKNKEFPALLHCFSSARELAFAALDLGIYISFSGIVTFKNAKNLQEIAKEIPLDKILVETDSPYLAPVPNRGKVNQPAFTRYVVEFLAQLRELEAQEVERQTSENFLRLFQIGIDSDKYNAKLF